LLLIFRLGKVGGSAFLNGFIVSLQKKIDY